MRLLAISIGLMVCLALVTACGAADEGTAGGTTVTGGPSKEQFIKRADQICNSADETQNELIAAFLKRRSNAPQGKALNEQMIAEVGLPPVRIEVKELDALVVPDGDEERIQAYLDEVEKAIDEGERDPSALLAGEALGPFEKASELARAYGFKACAFPH